MRLLLLGMLTCALACAPGYVPRNGACAVIPEGYAGAELLPCPPGSFGRGGNHSCAPCPHATYAPLPASANCTRCPFAMNTSAAGQSHAGACKCMPGSAYVQGNCSFCAPGTANPRLTLDADACKPCAAGTSSLPGSSACERCPEDTVAAEGADACSVCAAYYTPDADAAACVPHVHYAVPRWVYLISGVGAYGIMLLVYALRPRP